MARTRSIKPGIVVNEDLCDLGMAAYILFTGLWMFADRAGRLEDRPKRIKAQAMPLWDELSWRDVDLLLGKLADAGFLRRYQVADRKCIEIVNWKKHQHPDPREAASDLPSSSQCKASGDTLRTQCNSPESTPASQAPPTAAAPAASDQLQLIPFVASDAKVNGITLGAQCNSTEDTLTKRVGYGLWVMGYGSDGGAVVSGREKETASAPPPPPPPIDLKNQHQEQTPTQAAPPPIARKQPSQETRGGLQRATESDFRLPDGVPEAGDFTTGALEAPNGLLSEQRAYDLNRVADSLLALAEAIKMPRPDDDIVRQVLDAGRGATGETVHLVLVELYRRGKLREMRSWGLLPMLIRQWAAAA